MTNCKFLDRYCGASRRCNFISGVAYSCPATGVQCCSQSPTCVARFKESVTIHRVLKKHHQQRAPLLSNVALNMIVVPQSCFLAQIPVSPLQLVSFLTRVKSLSSLFVYLGIAHDLQHTYSTGTAPVWTVVVQCSLDSRDPHEPGAWVNN